MPYDLNLPGGLKRAGWKVKIRDAERLEVPHVTIMRTRDVWRLSLRTCSFLEEGQGWRQIDRRVRAAIEAKCAALRTAWNARYPENPISSENDDEND